MKSRCNWCARCSQLTAYHDQEWGVPRIDEIGLFEFLILEGAQAGLSWRTILLRRQAYLDSFAGFDPVTVARFSDLHLDGIVCDGGVIRNRKKIYSVRKNAQAFLRIQNAWGSFARFIWHFVDFQPLQNQWDDIRKVPTQNDISIEISQTLKNHGFVFVGPTICYAYMQACGLVNDHIIGCYRHDQVADMSGRVKDAGIIT